jgi:hypothetical protein
MVYLNQIGNRNDVYNDSTYYLFVKIKNAGVRPN